MFHQPHSSITRPALLVVVTNYVLIVRIWMLSEVTLDEITCFLRCEPEEKEGERSRKKRRRRRKIEIMHVGTRGIVFFSPEEYVYAVYIA